MDCSRIATYLPAWEDAKGHPTTAADEDVLTLAVAAGRAALGSDRASRVVLVCPIPDYLEGSPAALLPAALGLPASTVVEQRVGGADAALDALVACPAGSLVVGVDPVAPAGAGAALVTTGKAVQPAGSVSRSLPVTIRAVGEAAATEYDDPRLLRDRGWRVALDALRSDEPLAVLGVPAAVASSLGGDRSLAEIAVGMTGAAAPFFALAALSGRSDPVVLVALSGASGTAARVDGLHAEVVREARRRQPVPGMRRTPGDIPVSLAGLDRAQDAKIGFLGGACTSCGHIEFPPRYRCPQCGSEQAAEPASLGRTGSVYSTVTVHTPVPGKETPYSIAVVDLDQPRLRVLAPVTDAPPGSVRIGQPGHLVLRRVAVRQGIPDYMHAFQPAEEDD
jgi:uncharacterized OB-fold protein